MKCLEVNENKVQLASCNIAATKPNCCERKILQKPRSDRRFLNSPLKVLPLGSSPMGFALDYDNLATGALGQGKKQNKKWILTSSSKSSSGNESSLGSELRVGS